MKSANLSKVVGASILGLSLAVLPAYLPASAQTTTGGNTTGATNGTATGTTNDTGTGVGAGTGTSGYTATNNGGGDHGGYWGLLGLLGLFGLIGRGNKGQATAYRDPDEVSGRTGTTRY